MLKEIGLPVHGVMVETPQLMNRKRGYPGEVDFVSIGTNDLTQYTMMADRLLGDLAQSEQLLAACS